MEEFDYVIVGSGIAGLSLALECAEQGSVCLLTKMRGEDSNTARAQGGLACVSSAEDSFDLHVRDTLEAGAGLCDESVVRAIIEEGPARIAELTRLGVEFDHKTVDGHDAGPELGKEGGHSRRRVLHARDTTGREISEKLLARVREHPGIVLRERHFVIDLITAGKLGLSVHDRVLGLYVLDEEQSTVRTIRSDRVVLCTGGCGKIYLYSTNPDTATGDGVAMAWRAGARLSNMEFIQFHPTCLYHHEVKSFLISEAVRGEGGVLVGADGRAFMADEHPLKDLAPRDIVARAIDREIKRTGSRCVWVDITSRSKDYLSDRFPHIFETCAKVGIDISRDPIPVVPAAHYMCGGVETSITGRTSLRGLYAVGEVGCTGLHGANRLASNSLLEGLVVAHRAAADLAARFPTSRKMESIDLPKWKCGDVGDLDEMVVIHHNWDEVRRCMWDYVSIVRTTKRLRRAASRLRNLRREVTEFYWGFRLTVPLLELRNLVQTATLVVDSALMRHESRGLHYTLDYPEPVENERKPSQIVRW